MCKRYRFVLNDKPDYLILAIWFLMMLAMLVAGVGYAIHDAIF